MSPVIAVSVKKKNSLLVKVLKLFGILAGLCGCVMLREKDYDTKGPGSTLVCYTACYKRCVTTLKTAV